MMKKKKKEKEEKKTKKDEGKGYFPTIDFFKRENSNKFLLKGL